MEDRSRSVRPPGDALASLSALLLLGAAAALGINAARFGGSATTAGLQALLVVAGLAGAFAMWRRSGTRTVVTIVAVGLAAQFVLGVCAPLQSNDVYRYLWDGRLLLHGIDPYVVPPDAPQLESLRAGDWLYAHIDWRSVPTLYPPFDLALYALGSALSSGSVIPLKFLMIAGHIVTLALIATFLNARGLPLGRLALYAWNPLVIVEIGLNGHEEGWAFAFLVATIVAFGLERPFAAAAALGGAVLTKLYPAAFLPALFARRALLPAALVSVAVVIVAYAPFVLWNPDAFGFLHAFAFDYHFNDSIHRVVGTVGAAAIFGCALIFAALARARGAGAAGIVLGLEIVYLLLSPNVYPWYIAVFAAILPLIPSAFSVPMRPLALALIAWTALAPLAYITPWATPPGSPLDWAAHAVEYAPLVIAVGWYAVRDGRRIAAFLAGAVAVGGCVPANWAKPESNVQVARGAAFYAANCALCHTPTATSFIGPDLTHVVLRRSVPNLTAHIATSVPNGTTFPPATVAALVAYFQALNERSTHK